MVKKKKIEFNGTLESFSAELNFLGSDLNSGIVNINLSRKEVLKFIEFLYEEKKVEKEIKLKIVIEKNGKSKKR